MWCHCQPWWWLHLAARHTDSSGKVLQGRHSFESRGALLCNWAVLLKYLSFTDNFWSLSVPWKQCADASCFGSVVFASIGSFLCSDISKSGDFIAYQLRGEYLQGHFPSTWKMEGGWLCAGMAHQGSMFCKPTCSPSVGSKHRECEPNSSFQCPAEEFPSQPLSTATACWFCWFGFFWSASEWPPPCVTSPSGAQRARLLQAWGTCPIPTVRVKLLTSLRTRLELLPVKLTYLSQWLWSLILLML